MRDSELNSPSKQIDMFRSALKVNSFFAGIGGFDLAFFDGHLDWNYPWVDAKFVDLDDDANLVERQQKVRNFSKNEHVDQHAEWLKSLGYNEPLSADLVWKEREDRFPGLRFLTRVESDLLTLDGSGMVFEQAISAIQALSNDVCNWNKDQAWPIFSRKATPEGEQRKRLCWVVDEVTEEKALFDWHVRFTGNFPGRIHFRVDVADRQIIVAYVGSKLDRDIA
ncbi:hypothetical protein QU926_20935 [Pseudomonas asiatica]|uniref:hypothetical protein n=1 Tax=Pseudomonas asiatica TaxID=2219225 RepID=UPI0025AB0789|nr:hypothetical protein [Pseudomonas asiatica]MDM9556083.1 hypothetical protein [Pseudomonas asiatica]